MESMRKAWIRELYREHEHTCWYYKVKLRCPVIELSPTLSSWGVWDPSTRLITLSEALIQNHSWDQVINVLRHEMAHQMVSEVFQEQDAHGPVFQKACERLGVLKEFRCASLDLEKCVLPDWKKKKTDTQEQKLLSKVEKLLALSGSPNENEAILAMKKVRELYVKYNLESLERVSSDSDYVYQIMALGRKRVAKHKQRILSILTSHFFVEVIYGHLFNAGALESEKTAEILGKKPNVLMAEYVYEFLIRKLEELWKQYQSKNQISGRYKRSYVLGVLDGFDRKLFQQTESLKKEPLLENAKDRSLILMKDPQLDDFISYRFPRVSTRRRGAKDWVNTELYSAGKVDGGRLTLNRPVTSDQGNRGKLLAKLS
jgi:hypothetical protein